MEQLQIGDQVVRFDRQRTQAGYAALRCGSTDECDCASCRNFAAQRESAFPMPFRDLLQTLGIDIAKEGELYDSGPADDSVMYEGWFYFAGAVIQSGERLTAAGENFHYFFRDASPSNTLAMFGAEIATVEFQTTLPWRLRGSEEELS
jgi:hypothetical protein